MMSVLAFDFGASSGRAVKAEFDGEQISCQEIHRFENTPILVDGHTCHNVPAILEEIKTAIQKAGNIHSLAFDTWGVDYALLDQDGQMLHLPYHYRDGRTKQAFANALEKITPKDLYRRTGNQIMEINTLFQLLSDRNLERAETLLFMPDLFTYLLTGNKICERSIASTSQMMNPATRNWSHSVLDAFGIDAGIFPPLTESASIAGTYNNAKVVAVAGHDTQCAVAAMPCNRGMAAFLSCGTWSLIGCELDKPMLTVKSCRRGLSNELGANGRINYLKNISGLWLIQEVRRNLSANGRAYSYNELEILARGSKPFQCMIDPNDDAFSSPGGLPDKIRAYCQNTGQPVPDTVGELLRCIYESLALKYRYALEQISQCTGKEFAVLHMLGGGARDSFLCELTADCLNMPVIAGPAEATAYGNIILQLIALGEIRSVEEGRGIIAQIGEVRRYLPHQAKLWNEAYKRFYAMMEG